MRKEMERHDRERRKEEERLLREKHREEERYQREQRRELERREKFLQKESIRVRFLTCYSVVNCFFGKKDCHLRYVSMYSGRENEAKRRTAQRKGGCKA